MAPGQRLRTAPPHRAAAPKASPQQDIAIPTSRRPPPGRCPSPTPKGYFLTIFFLPGCHPPRVRASFDTMHHASITERVGHYVVTPLTHTTASGKVSAAVSIRRGVYDRVFRFIDQFDSRASATRYALQEGRSMVLCNQLS